MLAFVHTSGFRAWLAISALGVVTSSGCGPSLREQVARGDWQGACHTAEDDYDEITERNDYVVGEMAAGMDATISAHVFTQAELEQLLPYVPARLARGEVVLMTYAFDYRAGKTDTLSAFVFPGERASLVRCCEPAEWYALDDREEEWKEIEAKLEAEAERRRKLAERYSGPFGALRLIGETLAGVGRDLAYASTLGALNFDVSDLPGAAATPGEIIRRTREAVKKSFEDEGESADPEAEALAKRRAQSLLVLTQLLGEPGSCLAGPGEGCRSVSLEEVPNRSAAQQLTVGLYYETHELESCSVSRMVKLAPAKLEQPVAVRELFPRVSLRD